MLSKRFPVTKGYENDKKHCITMHASSWCCHFEKKHWPDTHGEFQEWVPYIIVPCVYGTALTPAFVTIAEFCLAGLLSAIFCLKILFIHPF